MKKAPDTYLGLKYVSELICLQYIKIILRICWFCTETLPVFCSLFYGRLGSRPQATDLSAFRPNLPPPPTITWNNRRFTVLGTPYRVCHGAVAEERTKKGK